MKKNLKEALLVERSADDIIEEIKTQMSVMMDEAIYYGKSGGDYGDPGEAEMNEAWEKIVALLAQLRTR